MLILYYIDNYIMLLNLPIILSSNSFLYFRYYSHFYSLFILLQGQQSRYTHSSILAIFMLYYDENCYIHNLLCFKHY